MSKCFEIDTGSDSTFTFKTVNTVVEVINKVKTNVAGHDRLKALLSFCTLLNSYYHFTPRT